MDKTGIWHISPTYDFTFTVDTSAPFYVNNHSMTINGNNRICTQADLIEVAARFNIKGATAIIEKCVETVTNYREYALKANVPEPWIKKIETEIAERITGMKS